MFQLGERCRGVQTTYTDLKDSHVSKHLNVLYLRYWKYLKDWNLLTDVHISKDLNVSDVFEFKKEKIWNVEKTWKIQMFERFWNFGNIE